MWKLKQKFTSNCKQSNTFVKESFKKVLDLIQDLYTKLDSQGDEKVDSSEISNLKIEKQRFQFQNNAASIP